MANSTYGRRMRRALLSQTVFPHTSIAITGSFSVLPSLAVCQACDNYSGLYKLVGTTSAGGVAYPAYVLVYPETSFERPIRSTYSADGTFTFTYLAAGTYMVLAVDPTGTYRSLSYSFVNAVPM